MSDDIDRRIRQLASDVLNLPLAAVSDETSPRNVESWDSIQHLNLLLALEQEFSVQFEPEQIEQMRSVGDVIAITRARLAQL